MWLWSTVAASIHKTDNISLGGYWEVVGMSDIDVLCDEWQLYPLESIAKSLIKDLHDSDHFLGDVFAIVGINGSTLK